MSLLQTIGAAIGILALAGPAGVPQQPRADPARQTDAQVIEAVLAQTVRREVDGLLARPDGWRGSPLVLLNNRTLAICPDRSAARRDVR
jgi:hypothetical protein